MKVGVRIHFPAIIIIIMIQINFGFKDTNSLSTLYSKISDQRTMKMKAAQNHTKDHSSFKKLLSFYDYIDINNITIIHNYGRMQVKKLRFVHIPKTGTTFAATVVHYCCSPALDNVYINVLMPFASIIPGDYYCKMFCGKCLETQARSHNGDPWAHIPFRIGIDSYISTAIFRNPSTRLASQLIYTDYIGFMSESFGYRRVDSMMLISLLRNKSVTLIRNCMEQLIQRNDTEIKHGKNKLSNYAFRYDELRKLDYSNSLFHKKVLECIDFNTSHVSSIRNNEKYLQCKYEAVLVYPGLLGCQTKMILGRQCFDIYEVTSEDLIEAKRRIKEEFLFIGIHEQWEKSVRSFHKQYGGKLFSDELLKHRASKSIVHQRVNLLLKAAATQSSVIPQSHLRDHWDNELYQYALTVFHSKLYSVF